MVAQKWRRGGAPLAKGVAQVRHTAGTRMEIRTWRSAIADLRGPPPGAPSGALEEGTLGWVWRCDAAISRYHKKTCLFVRFSRAAKTLKWRHFR